MLIAEKKEKPWINWRNGPNEDGSELIAEILVDGDIEVVEIMKEINANIPEKPEA